MRTCRSQRHAYAHPIMKTAACESWPMSLAKNWPRPRYSRNGFWRKSRNTTARTSHAITRPIRSTMASIASASRSSAFGRRGTRIALARVLDLEERVLDDAEDVAERVGDGADLDALSDVLHLLVHLRIERHEPRHFLRGVRHAPVDDRSLRARGSVGNEPQLEAAHRVADVVRLIEIGLMPHDLAVPRLPLGKIGDRIDHRSQSLNHVGSPLIEAVVRISELG